MVRLGNAVLPPMVVVVPVPAVAEEPPDTLVTKNSSTPDFQHRFLIVEGGDARARQYLHAALSFEELQATRRSCALETQGRTRPRGENLVAHRVCREPASDCRDHSSKHR